LRRIYRVLRKAFANNPFDGEGAYRYGGRWSSPGIRLSYASEHQSLAMLEYFVHLDKDEPPDDLVLAAADIPQELEADSIDQKLLPENWRDAAAPAELARFGDQFAKRGLRCLLWVPSVLAPNERNCLLNPAHPDFRTIALHSAEPLRYDSRMFRKARRKH
jgi:RES domain-containing protein